MATKKGEEQVISERQLDLAAESIRSGSAGMLRLGSVLHEWREQGVSMSEAAELLQRRGVDLPSAGRRSIFANTYEAWCVRAGVTPTEDLYHESFMDPVTNTPIPMRITGVPIDKLYLLKDDVDDTNASELLAEAFLKTEGELRNRKSGRRRDDSERDEEQPRVKTLKLNEDSYDAFLHILDRLRGVTGDANITKAQAFDFVVGQFDPDSIGDDALHFLWRQAHGDLTPEEVAESERVELELA